MKQKPSSSTVVGIDFFFDLAIISATELLNGYENFAVSHHHPITHMVLQEIERRFEIKLNQTVEKIFADLEKDQVSRKEYLIFEGDERWLPGLLTIIGVVDDYEPHDIWLEVRNISKKDVPYLNGLVMQ